MPYKYQHLVVGGTFDRLHAGHRQLLLHAFKLGRQVTIGITADDFPTAKIANGQTSILSERKKTLKRFLEKNHLLKRTKLLVIKDIFGTTKTDKTINAILVTRETIRNALKINRWRADHGLYRLTVELMPLIKSADHKIVRSSRIRLGQIDRSGNIYGRLFMRRLQLPQDMRGKLRKPLGEVYHQLKSVKISPQLNWGPNGLMIAVGDIISQNLQKQKIVASVKIVDFRSRREPIKNVADPKIKIKPIVNRPGYIYPRAAFQIRRAINDALLTKKPQIIVVLGEEDLLALPAILLAPLGTVVLYGQMGVGVVMVRVTEEKKQEIVKLIQRFMLE